MAVVPAKTAIMLSPSTGSTCMGNLNTTKREAKLKQKRAMKEAYMPPPRLEGCRHRIVYGDCYGLHHEVGEAKKKNMTERRRSRKRKDKLLPRARRNSPFFEEGALYPSLFCFHFSRQAKRCSTKDRFRCDTTFFTIYF